MKLNPIKKQPSVTEENISSGSFSANWALGKQTLPWLLLFLLLQEDLVLRVGLVVQGGLDLPLVQSHQLVPKNYKRGNVLMTYAGNILKNPRGR